MCGIAGFLSLKKIEEPEGCLAAMAGAMRHRGPDSNGTWLEAGPVSAGLAHARLSILDLSPMGHQPMSSGSGRYVIVYNGEVYNYREIRGDLENLGQSFNGASDTEVVIAAIETWGVEDAISRFVGMFAFALWDRQIQSLTLVRDRLGIKPLYVGLQQGLLVFSSELKPIKQIDRFELNLDRDSLTAYLRYGCIPSPYSVFENVWKLPPGHMVTVGEAELAKGEGMKFSPFWSAADSVANGKARPFEGSPEDAVQRLDEVLRDAVASRMVADVPLGAFLSGGIDSSAVVALMQAQSSSRVKTFSIGFGDKEYDEAIYAKKVAEHLGTDHTELYLKGQDALDVVPDLPRFYDEPFADSSQIPTYLVSRMAREDVTVALSGDGGDELFAGYNRYGIGLSVWKMAQKFPMPVRGMARTCLTALRREQLDYLYERLKWAVPSRLRMRTPGYKAQKFAEMINLTDTRELYESLISHWDDPGSLILDGAERQNSRSAIDRESPGVLDESFVEQMMYYDLVNYLPEDLLTKVDRASMAVSLEVRVPVIDHRVVEFAWSLPLEYKLRNGVTKWVLREVLAKYVPRELFERPKMGFGIPVESWLREDLRDWAEDLLDEGRLRDDGIFACGTVRSVWDEHLSGRMDWHFHLWFILMFQAWKAEWET